MKRIIVGFWYDQDDWWRSHNVFGYGFWIFRAKALSQFCKVLSSTKGLPLRDVLRMSILRMETGRCFCRGQWSCLHSLLGTHFIILECLGCATSSRPLVGICFHNWFKLINYTLTFCKSSSSKSREIRLALTGQSRSVLPLMCCVCTCVSKQNCVRWESNLAKKHLAYANHRPTSSVCPHSMVGPACTHAHNMIGRDFLLTNTLCGSCQRLDHAPCQPNLAKQGCSSATCHTDRAIGSATGMGYGHGPKWLCTSAHAYLNLILGCASQIRSNWVIGADLGSQTLPVRPGKT